MSAATLLAAYGDCGFNGCASVIGVNCADPYTSLVEVQTRRAGRVSSAASRTFCVPRTLTFVKL
jgi:hypothetical protein